MNSMGLAIACFALGWACTLSAVIVGGFIGYRAKHGGYEPFVSSPNGKAFNMEDPLDKVFGHEEGTEDERIRPPDILKRMNVRFRTQVEKDLGVEDVV